MTEQALMPAATSAGVVKRLSCGDTSSAHYPHDIDVAAAVSGGHAGCSSFVDSLTGVHNRAYAVGRAQQLLKSAHAARVAVLIVNLDGFSKINDIAGYDLGDRVLRSVAQRLAGSIDQDDLLARIGGDEFVIVADDHGDASTLTAFAQHVLALFREPFVIGGHEYRVSASVGVALSNGEPRDAAALMRDAGSAMRRGKLCGPGRLRIFTGDVQEDVQRRFRIEELLHHALSAGELKLAYQAVIDAASRETIGAEVLLRWSSSELGDVAPAEFIPVAEEAGLMESIGDWVLEQACAQAADWRWSIAPSFAVSVNISPVQFNERLVRQVAACLANSGLEASALQLEITEGMLMPDDAAVRATTAALATLGVKLAVDDFGTGYASLSYLKRFPLHSLKIDRSFVAGLPRDTDSLAITHALVKMAHACGMCVTAEGVETEEQATALCEMGCDMLQGYLFNRPGSAADLAGVLSRASRLNRRRRLSK
ncbi:putative bifunctional diguanylate cyclase/phosphodiesterase [Paraburkholderia rhynchosiae]|uniref:Bifunctional diguanylate cyclase/phosphodiesterase n=1 Tax=Paraburkholderia rhynchosiae TaxID=487049 RepID=A0A2N7WMP2_9BURK|nr:bifunctional diguanylate cyclase/phosphodiesterase [Paraburkholderia rhynchosiae]PMS30680.1 bifunctional diguanylate cyclase/phosphodiesterase [Paraburkholderia rhynchosiae]CAB3686369.1 putative signaling protein [Paraburkholderia rhynchosiae]